MDHLIQIIHGGIVIFIGWMVWLALLQWPIDWWRNRRQSWVRREFILFAKALGWIAFYVALAWVVGYVWLSLT